EFGSYGEGRFTPHNQKGGPLTITFAEENFDHLPDPIALGTSAKEDDAIPAISDFLDCVSSGGCTVGANAPYQWRVPQGVEYSSQRVILRGDGNSGFASALTFHLEVLHDDIAYPSARNFFSNTWNFGVPL